MSRIITDDGLLSWEVYASGGNFGLPQRPKVIFHCISDPDRRSRYVEHNGDNATAQGAVATMDDAELRTLFTTSREID
ncbi:MAG: hypothetical protein WD737_04635 [Gemmatimonadota bacterium]